MKSEIWTCIKLKKFRFAILVLLFIAIAVTLPKFQTYYLMYQHAVNGFKRVGTAEYPTSSEVLKQVILYGTLLVMLIVSACFIIMKTIKWFCDKCIREHKEGKRR